MKKNIIIFLMVFILLVSFTGCTVEKNTTKKTDAMRFKEEYESLNGEKNKNNGKEYRPLEIKEDNTFIYKDATDIVEMLENKETFVVYFGFASCPWCRSIIPTLIETADDLGIYPIYYVDVKEIRDIMIINEEGNTVTEKEGSEAYYQLLEKMTSVLEDYVLTTKDGKEIKTGEKRIYAPNIVSVIDGEAIQMTDGISPNQTDAYMELTDNIQEESYDKIKCSIECIADSQKTCSAKTRC